MYTGVCIYIYKRIYLFSYLFIIVIIYLFGQSFSDVANMLDIAKSHFITAHILTGAVSCLFFH